MLIKDYRLSAIANLCQMVKYSPINSWILLRYKCFTLRENTSDSWRSTVNKDLRTKNRLDFWHNGLLSFQRVSEMAYAVWSRTKNLFILLVTLKGWAVLLYMQRLKWHYRKNAAWRNPVKTNGDCTKCTGKHRGAAML